LSIANAPEVESLPTINCRLTIWSINLKTSNQDRIQSRVMATELSNKEQEQVAGGGYFDDDEFMPEYGMDTEFGVQSKSKVTGSGPISRPDVDIKITGTF
jgi:hypothetical protein